MRASADLGEEKGFALPTGNVQKPNQMDDTIVYLTAVACLGRKAEDRNASPKTKGIKLSAPRPGKRVPIYQMHLGPQKPGFHGTVFGRSATDSREVVFVGSPLPRQVWKYASCVSSSVSFRWAPILQPANGPIPTTDRTHITIAILQL